MDKYGITKAIKITAAFIVALLMSASVAFAEGEVVDPEMILNPSGLEDMITMKAVNVDGMPYFFMPSGVADEDIETVPGEGVSYETMQSANIASVHFFSKDPQKGFDYVNTDKENKAKGEIYMFDESFDEIYHGSIDTIKGRGNTTWKFTDKKSYQIKLDKKADLLDPENGSQKAKKWILLANPFDPTLMRNYMIYNFGKEIGLENSPEGRPVDFYYDGVYRGSYYLCEKVEIGDGRVEIEDLEKDVENANPDVDFDELSEVTGTSSKGLEIKYEEGITEPEDISGGYLIELDSIYYEEEKSWFKYYGLCAASIKSPEYNSEAMVDYTSGLLSDLYRYCLDSNKGKNDGSKLSEMIDMDSFARYFLVNEWFGNGDVWTSSTFVYKPRGDKKLYAGPLWDCDSTMQGRTDEKTYDFWFATKDGLQPLADQMFRMPVFRRRVKKVYEEDFRSVIFDILLGTKEGQYLKPALAMKEELAASEAMDYRIWGINDCLGSYSLSDTPEENYEDIMNWMQNRAEWVDKEIMADSFAPKYDRIYGDTRYETSLKTANAFKEKLGVDKFDNIILACGTNYADALAGSYLSSVKKAPILLVDNKQDHIDAVQAYIKANVKSDGMIYMLGGEAVVPETVIAGLDGYNTVRLGGKDRYETNVLILKEAAKDAGEVNEYLVASGTGFADSLSASAVGKPIILVKNAVQNSQAAYIDSLKGKQFYIIGGTGAVNTEIESVLKALGSVKRIDGATRYETSANVAAEFFDKPASAVVAYGANFPDGLCGGPLACSMDGPLLLAAKGKADAAITYANKSGVNNGAILGGPTLINDVDGKMIFN